MSGSVEIRIGEAQAGRLGDAWKRWALYWNGMSTSTKPGCGCVHCRSDFSQHPAHKPPSQVAQNHERDFAASKVLLAPDILVGRHQDIEDALP